MNVIRRVVDIFVQRFVASVGSMLAARMETVAALMHAEQQDELEQRARQLEADGKPHLADDLRSRASQLARVNTGLPAIRMCRVLSRTSRGSRSGPVSPKSTHPATVLPMTTDRARSPRLGGQSDVVRATATRRTEGIKGKWK